MTLYEIINHEFITYLLMGLVVVFGLTYQKYRSKVYYDLTKKGLIKEPRWGGLKGRWEPDAYSKTFSPTVERWKRKTRITKRIMLIALFTLFFRVFYMFFGAF